MSKTKIQLILFYLTIPGGVLIVSARAFCVKKSMGTQLQCLSSNIKLWTLLFIFKIIIVYFINT